MYFLDRQYVGFLCNSSPWSEVAYYPNNFSSVCMLLDFREFSLLHPSSNLIYMQELF